ncbi:filamin-binding LIM protein 1 isoform X1 [Takifugu flavidus]|uniref:filamin-binding LIM protein 1 isoform X1 n=1 Tax=Takifugu flavidus TaxID=433684 RepID=UPI002544BF39|nr:filamin-binding LIM protein 1 isoform X1 [Takifugu flavidus]XP_056885398.1 filamin-binding LIM protein 1 isoform X1 [Takifugu flavidus]
MASAAPQKRMVSSFFITLASPHRATVTQQQPVLQAHSSPACDTQHTAVRVHPGDSIPSARRKKEDCSQPGTQGGLDSEGWSPAAASVPVFPPQSPKPTEPECSRGNPREGDCKAADHLPPPPPPAALTSSLETSISQESALPPPPPVQANVPHPLTPGQHPVYNREVQTKTPASRFNQEKQSHGIHKNGQDTDSVNKEVCGFCRKPVALSEPAIEALNRTYHDGCFQCRSCHCPLAGKQYYNKAGIPLCTDCYQASLELCWACGDAITDNVVRALERAYHVACFTCATCKQQIGEQAFAQGEVGEVYCLEDYYRKYAPKCNACNHSIIPKEDGTDSYIVECLGRSYHENCYRCQVCVIQLSPEPNEHGCYPLDGRMLCKACHLSLISGQL